MVDLVENFPVLKGIVMAEHNFVQGLQAASGFPEDQLKTVLCMLAAYPIAFIFKSFPNIPALKHFFSIALGIFFCIYTLGRWSWLHLFGSSLVAYLILLLASPKISHKLVFFWAMGYITLSHIYRLYTDYLGWSLDYTGPQMLLTLKLSSLGWNYYDGVANKNATDKQKAYAITKLPNLLEFYGWVFFFPSLLAGPAIEISEYLSYINLSMFKSVPENKNRRQEDYVIPSTIWPTMVVLGRTLIITVGLLASALYFPHSLLLSESFKATPFFQRIILLHIVISLVRFKYYFAWLLAEGSCLATGLGYNGVDKNGNMLFDRCTNVWVLKVEVASNVRDMSNYWNIGTAVWLRKYIYERVQHKNSLVPLLATYVTSAFWHGFYPGYYLFFITGGILTEIAREARRRIRPRFLKLDGTKEVGIQPWKTVYDVTGTILIELALSYTGPAFLFLSWEKSLEAWAVFHYLGHVAIALAFIGVRLIPAPRSPALAAKKAE